MNEPLTPEQHNFVTPHEHPHALDEEGRCMVCSISYAGGVLYKQITALRQRVTELEHENKNLLTCQCEQCDNSLEEEAVCGNCYRKSQSLLENEKENVKASCQVLNEKDQQVADLTAQLAQAQATIVAREKEVDVMQVQRNLAQDQLQQARAEIEDWRQKLQKAIQP
jgi:chromosome segregation ATPase